MAVTMPSCHTNFKPRLKQVSTDTGEQHLNIGQGKIPAGLESCLLEAEKAHQFIWICMQGAV